MYKRQGLGLDSIDALEIILILERNYGIKIENPAKGKMCIRDSQSTGTGSGQKTRDGERRSAGIYPHGYDQRH